MPSKYSITQCNKFVSRDIGEHIPKKLHGLFLFGVRSFTLQSITSCNSNARVSHQGSRNAAEQQMYRLLRHSKLFLLVWRAVAEQLPLKDNDIVNVDYSNLGPLAILGFAKQTKRGRAIPVLMRSLASNTQGQKKTHPKYQKLKDYYLTWKKTVQADQYTFVIKSLILLRYIYSTQPKLVFDRGFANKTIVKFLIKNNWVFYIRMRENFKVSLNGNLRYISGLPQGSYTIVWAGQILRLIITKTRSRYPQPWYIITNDNATLPTKIAKFYYHRFEIEESFRDLKGLFNLKGSRIRTWQSLRVVLCFMSLAIIVAMSLYKSKTVDNNIPKKSLSIVRMWQEQINKERLRITTRKLQISGVIGDV